MFSLKKQQKWQTFYFKFIYHKNLVSTVASSVDDSNSMDIVIAKKKREEKRKRKLAKLKTRKGGLGKNERPGGFKTRKGDPGKNKRHAKEKYIFPVDWKPEREIQAKVRDFKKEKKKSILKRKAMTIWKVDLESFLVQLRNGDFCQVSAYWAIPRQCVGRRALPWQCLNLLQWCYPCSRLPSVCTVMPGHFRTCPWLSQ